MTEAKKHSYVVLPSFRLLNLSYIHDDDYRKPKRDIGGDVNAEWIRDTCAIRMSRALNYSNFPLPAKGHSHMLVVQGADHKWYALRHAELRSWLYQVAGPPQLHQTKKDKISRAFFRGHKGIIALDVPYVPRPGEIAAATGHIDLWDGNGFAGEASQVGTEDSDFSHATDVALWFTPD